MPASPDHAIILFAHGARDARWAQTLQVLRAALLARQPHARVESAFLEFQTPSLEQALNDAVVAGCKRIDIAPVFWATGGHVTQDVPPMVEAFRHTYPDVQVEMLPVLSELPGMAEFIADAVHALVRKPS